jgi:hypothetical protein
MYIIVYISSCVVVKSDDALTSIESKINDGFSMIYPAIHTTSWI